MKSKTLKFKITALICAVLCMCLALCSCGYYFDFLSDNQSEKEAGVLAAHFLDVGQGDSIFIEMPNAQTMLIDAGVSGCGEGIEDYINELGYSKIDYLVATHPHADHIGSMAYIVENMDIENVYMPKVATTTKTFEKLLTSISDKGLKIKDTKAGDTIYSDADLSVDVLAPVEIDEDDLNNCSIVIKMTYKNRSFLFTGDAEEKELDTVYSDMSADVLKVGHHGSRTSTYDDFLEQVNPSIGVISLGKDNDYGHPHRETLNLLKDYDVEIYRTDKDGTVTISTDGENLNVETNGPSMIRN